MGKDLHEDKVLAGHVDVDSMVQGIIDCLDTDPVVALHLHPEESFACAEGNQAGGLADRGAPRWRRMA